MNQLEQSPRLAPLPGTHLTASSAVLIAAPVAWLHPGVTTGVPSPKQPCGIPFSLPQMQAL